MGPFNDYEHGGRRKKADGGILVRLDVRVMAIIHAASPLTVTPLSLSLSLASFAPTCQCVALSRRILAFDTVLVVSFPSIIRPNLSLPGPDRLPQLRKLF